MYGLIRRILFLLSSDMAHDLVAFLFRVASLLSIHKIGRAHRVPAGFKPVTLGMVTFPHPVMMAAGFDKNGMMLSMLQWLGFSGVEVGSVTAIPSRGNAKPRLLRLPPSRALINRCGLNNQGVDRVMKRLMKRRRGLAIPVGVSIAKSHDPTIMGESGIDDLINSFEEAKKVADYITINLSCPNTTEGKTFETLEALQALFARLKISEDTPPILLKFSPDLDLETLHQLMIYSLSRGVRGFILCNTTKDRTGLSLKEKNLANEFGRGGLSGAPLKEGTLARIAWARAVLPADTFLVASGGLEGMSDYLRALVNGANLIQIYSSFIYRGRIW